MSRSIIVAPRTLSLDLPSRCITNMRKLATTIKRLRGFFFFLELYSIHSQ